MWKEPIEVRRSLTERMLDDWDYQYRRFEAKADRAIDNAIEGFFDGLIDLFSDIFDGLRRR